MDRLPKSRNGRIALGLIVLVLASCVCWNSINTGDKTSEPTSAPQPLLQEVTAAPRENTVVPVPTDTEEPTEVPTEAPTAAPPTEAPAPTAVPVLPTAVPVVQPTSPPAPPQPQYGCDTEPNCDAFTSWTEMNDWWIACGRPAKYDKNGDGVPCEALRE